MIASENLHKTRQKLTRFSAPIFDRQLHLERDLKKLKISKTTGNYSQLIFIEGQAGQGKTTLAAQLLTSENCPYLWYRVDDDDISPQFLLNALFTGLSNRSPLFKALSSDRIIPNEGFSQDQIPYITKQLIKVLEESITDDFLIVFDDIHLCRNSPQTYLVLQLLMNSLPPSIRMILCSRSDLTPLSKVASTRKKTVYIDNQNLAFSSDEIARFFNGLLSCPLTSKAVQLLKEHTNGWAMGLSLTGEQLAGLGPARIEKRLSSIQNHCKETFAYVLAEAVDSIPEGWYEILLKLSVLDYIPVDLAKILTANDDIETILNRMSKENRFITPLDGDLPCFVLHHLFRDALRHRFLEEKSSQDRQLFHTLAAEWYLRQQEPEKAISHYIVSENYLLGNHVLKKTLLERVGQISLTTLDTTIRRLPKTISLQFPWFSYLCGVNSISSNPAAALPLLQQAFQQFKEDEDELGELLASVQIIFFGISVDGNYSRSHPFLSRSMQLFDCFSTEINAPLRAHIANTLLFANTILTYDPLHAEKLLNLGLNISRSENLPTLEAEARMARCYYFIIRNDWNRCRTELEGCLLLIHNPAVNTIYRGGLCLAYLQFLEINGDFSTYDRMKVRFRSSGSEQLRNESVFEAYLKFWDTHMYFTQGDFLQAIKTVESALQFKRAVLNPHLRNLHLTYHAILLAQNNQEKAALEAISQARKLRTAASASHFEALNESFYGAAFTLLGKHDEALDCFDHALRLSPLYNETALAWRAFLYLENQEEELASADIKSLILTLQEKGSHCFYGWTPMLMTRLLSTAVRLGIKTDYARHLARERLDLIVLEDGTTLPLLNYRALGPMQINVNNETFSLETEFSPQQRQIIASLLSSPELRISLDKLQCNLWPDSSKKLARTSVGTAISRLRKTLETLLSRDMRHYLQLKNGILSLRHSRVDALSFEQEAKKGISHFKAKEYLQAENHLFKAVNLYTGEFLPVIYTDDGTENYRRALQLTYQKTVLALIDVLAILNASAEGIPIIEKALSYDPTHEGLNRVLYSLKIEFEGPLYGQRVVDDYRLSLQKNGHEDQDISEIIEEFWAVSQTTYSNAL